MPYANNLGVNIHYHVEGNGPPLVIQHGLTGSLKNWYAYGFVEKLQKDYRLILVDARGHGLSDKPHDSKEYDLRLRVDDILAVIDDLGVDKAHYLGYSMGGRIGFGIVKYALERFHSLIIGGMGADVANTDVPPEFRIELLRKGMDAYVADDEAKNGLMELWRRNRLLDNDPEALIAATTAPMGTDGVEVLLPSLNIPFMLYCGELDGFFLASKAASKAIPGAEFVPLPGMDHGQASRDKDVILPYISKFLEKATPKIEASG